MTQPKLRIIQEMVCFQHMKLTLLASIYNCNSRRSTNLKWVSDAKCHSHKLMLFRDQQLCACLLAVHCSPNLCAGRCGSRSSLKVSAKTLPPIPLSSTSADTNTVEHCSNTNVHALSLTLCFQHVHLDLDM